ncbi:hypothetical protein [Paenibacillus sp. DMB5]|uniref:hypothetical protein n=1 Tax=Paenibacillus sp. DMB5 TaxID=1780103 RepID=UPI00076C8AC2|nr:hypothetical protein [Paenibacillus sp. DMB5]KUP25427.1 hypothetical protein AWJ19_06450 [Paenibacillus sp. DMB5]
MGRKWAKTQFKEAFKRGLGSSYLMLKESNNREKYRDIVLWCCLRNTCYDTQCEGGRGSFLYQAIFLYENKDYFEEAIIRKFMQKNLDMGLFSQLCELLYLFAADGSMKAREALYEKYNALLGSLSRRNSSAVRESLEWLSVWLTSLDGFPAFKSIVIQFGEYSLNNSEAVNMDWFYSNAKNKLGAKRVDTFLQSNAAKSDYVKAFLNSVIHTVMQNERSVEPPTLEKLIEAAKEKQSRFRSRGLALRFSRTATEDELLRLAEYAVQETDLEIKLELLWTFKKVRFPLDEQFIFELTESDNEAIRDVAFEMLQHVPSDRIHGYAIDLIKQRKELANALSLLCYCYTAEDETILLEGIQSLPVTYEDGEWHGVFMDVEKLLDNRPVKMNSSLFIYMYRQTLCSYCRHKLIKRMSKRKILSQEILEECVNDSYEDTRDFAVRKLGKKPGK